MALGSASRTALACELHRARLVRLRAHVSRTPGGRGRWSRWESRWMFRGGLHRVAAVVMLAALRFPRRAPRRRSPARACIVATLTGRHDVTELREDCAGSSDGAPRCRGPPRSATPRSWSTWRSSGASSIMAVTGFIALVRELVARASSQVGDRRRDGRPLLRSHPRDARHPGLALLLRDLRPPGLPDGHRLAHRTRGARPDARADGVDARPGSGTPAGRRYREKETA